MRKHRHTRGIQPAQQLAPVPNFELLADMATEQVEHRITLDFLRLIPHAWNADEIEKFSTRAKRMAEALPLAWVTVKHPQLGVVRSYPVPFLQWIFGMMAKEFSWPMPAIALAENARDQRDELRAHQNARRHLQSAADHVPTPELGDALKKVMQWLDCETQRLRSVEEPTPPAGGPPPLRAI